MEGSATIGVDELTIEVQDRDCVFVDASASEHCTVVGERTVQRSDGVVLEFFSVTGTAPDDALAAMRSHESTSEARLVHSTGEEALIEALLDGPCVSRTLADEGAILRSAIATDGRATVVADVPASIDPTAVADRFSTIHSRSRVTAKRTCPDRILGLPDSDRTAILNRLTDKQRHALEAALVHGYFAWPRERSAEECAAALDISQPTFSQHLRHGQRKLLGALLADTIEPNEHRHDA